MAAEDDQPALSSHMQILSIADAHCDRLLFSELFKNIRLGVDVRHIRDRQILF